MNIIDARVFGRTRSSIMQYSHYVSSRIQMHHDLRHKGFQQYTRLSSYRLFRSGSILCDNNSLVDRSDDKNLLDATNATSQPKSFEKPLLSSSPPIQYSWVPPKYRPPGIVWKVCSACKGTGMIPDKLKTKSEVYFEEMKTGQEFVDRGNAPCAKCRVKHSGASKLTRGLTQHTRHRQRSRLVDDDEDMELIEREDEYSYTDPSQPQMLPIRIIVIGAGLSGLATAVALRHRGFRRVDVYDARSGMEDFMTPQHGYTLELIRPDPIIASLGLPPLPNIPTTVRAAPHHLMSGITGEPIGMRYYVGDDPPFSPPSIKENVLHVAKPALWYELFHAATTATINDVGSEDLATVVNWNHEFRGFRTFDDRVEVTLAKKSGPNGEKEEIFTETADLLVGADGLWSTVRAALIPRDVEAPVRYLGCLAITGIARRGQIQLRDSSVRHLINGKTTFQAADGETHWIVQPYNETEKEIAWQVSFRMPLKEAKQMIKGGSAALLNEAKRRCDRWPIPIPNVLSATPEELVTGHCVYDRELTPKLRSMMVPIQRQTPLLDERVALIGDAAHPLPLFKGQGALQALQDGLTLAKLLYRHAVPGNPASSYSKIYHNDDPEEMQFPAYLVHESVRQLRADMMERIARPLVDGEETTRNLHTKSSLLEKGTIRRVATVPKRSLTDKA